MSEQIRAKVKDILTCPHKDCGLTFESFAKTLDHFALKHRRLDVYFWQMAHFNTSDLTERLKNPVIENENPDLVDLSKFSEEDLLVQDGSETQKISLNLANKLLAIGINKTVIQPTACFALSDHLEPCHECWKVKMKRGNVGSICQFEGFRKVKRIMAGAKTPFAFEANGFLDPFSDPSDADRKVWITPTKKGLDKDFAKFIISQAGADFCHLANAELDLIAKYKTKLQDEKCVIWKRLQYKVREMCDVCSTSLFNAHFTCTECGIIVCTDCHQTRMKGNLSYQGSSGTYKSKKRRVNAKAFDSHYWPFCKVPGHEHQPEKLILTQIICGDILKDMLKKLHKVKAQHSLSFNCCLEESKEIIDPGREQVTNFLNPISQQPQVIEEVIQVKSEDAIETKVEVFENKFKEEHKFKEENKFEDENKFIEGISTCPICKQSLNKDKPLSPGLHFVGHFKKELMELLPSEAPFKCSKCELVSPDLMGLMLHVGLAHGEFERQIVWRQKKLLSLKNIVLNVDKQENCKVCGMIYSHHMMTFPLIRKHLFTHFREDIQKMFIVDSSGKNFKCPMAGGCDFKTSNKGKLTDHVAIFHRHLDTMVANYQPPLPATPPPTQPAEPKEPPRKKLSLKDYKKVKPANVKVIEEVVNKETQMTCVVCDLKDAKDAVQKHMINTHFTREIYDLVSMKGNPDTACPDCPADLDVVHLGIKHQFLDVLLGDEELIRSKKRAVKRKSSSLVDLSRKRAKLEFFKCNKCATDLKSHDEALDHFSTHIWISMRYINKKPNSLDLCNSLISQIPLEDYLAFHELCPIDKEAIEFTSKLKQRIEDILKDQWCSICLKNAKDVKHKNHDQQDKSAYFEKTLTCTEDVENLRSIISPTKHDHEDQDKGSSSKGNEYCEWCIEGFKKNDYYKHTALVHFKSLFKDIIIPDFTRNGECMICKEDLKPGSSDEEILHFAQHHRLLDRYLILIKNDKKRNQADKKDKDIFDENTAINIINGDKKMYTCKHCNANFQDIQSLRLHVKDSFKKSWPWPKVQPFICPECYYEAATYLSLFKHVGTKHGEKQDLKKMYSSIVAQDLCKKSDNKPPASKEIVSVSSKKNFVISLPAEKPKIKFKDFMKKTLKGLDMHPEETVDDEPDAKVAKAHKGHETFPRVICSSVIENQAPHHWLCDGRLLVLEDPRHAKNIHMFQDQWKRGQPVTICNSSDLLDKYLWHPEAFRRDFGHLRHDLVNCLTGKTVPRASLDDFWSGFQWIKHRLRDTNGTPMLLKLKDWPPTDDIANYMPVRFGNFVDAYPMHEYTHREGDLNLASYLPEYALKPELGPKMYIAYGSALYSDRASTNLHIDMSDAVNCLVYVGFPKDGNMQENAKQVFREVDKAGCDIVMKRRIRSRNILPGALWHVFHPLDTVKIRDFLNKVALEKGVRLDPHDDPIHDQSTYLDEKLRRRLYQEYGVRAYSIVQCAGDTVFIPAGAAHQVRNLHNCIKVAEDFVSPENISHCLHLTQEFRHLTEWHTNHEDKLQIKTILYHAIKTAISVLDQS